jgi:hypothetical protein
MLRALANITTNTTGTHANVMSPQSEAGLIIGLGAIFIGICCCLGCGRRGKGHSEGY